MSDRRSGDGFFQGLLFGILGGAVMGILFAPEPGEETRKRLKKKGKELRDKAVEIAGEVEDAVGPLVEEAKRGVKEVAEEIEDAAEPVKDTARQKLDDLEEELARTKRRFSKELSSGLSLV